MPSETPPRPGRAAGQPRPVSSETPHRPGRAAGQPRPMPSDVLDPGLAAVGQPRIDWARRTMPVLARLTSVFADQQPLAGLTVAACLHVTPETAGLVRLLTAGGARVQLAASNPLSTQDAIAAALGADPRVSVYA